MWSKILFALLLFLSAPASADNLPNFNEGFYAYNHGEWRQAILILRPLVEIGDYRAMILLGNMYGGGYGVEQDNYEALSLYIQAAETANNTQAMNAAAAIYTSIGSAKLAQQWFLRSAQLGDDHGAAFYATLMYRGNQSPTDDIKSDFQAAYKWFSIAAKTSTDAKFQDQNRKLAQAIVVRQHLAAEDVAKIDKEVAEWKPADPNTLGPFPDDPVPPPTPATPTAPTPPEAVAPATPAPAAESSKK
jgi:TPR repeat protein